MLKSIIIRSIGKFEKQTGYDASYMKEMAHLSPKLALLFNKFIKLNNYRQKTPLDEMMIAKIASMKTEDCGPCLQLNINFALWEGVKKEYVQNAVQSPEKLPKNLKLIHDFAVQTATNQPDVASLQQEVEKIYGRDIVIELALAIATSRVYPATKRAMGLAKSCRLMEFNFGK